MSSAVMMSLGRRRYIKALHKAVKTGTLSADAEEAVVGDYKKYLNYVGDMGITQPCDVKREVNSLLRWYVGIRIPVC